MITDGKVTVHALTGGLRGAVAFALVLVVNEHIIPTKKMMVTTIIAIVYFTVFLQGVVCSCCRRF